jgi:putative SOS response-associated peptidase YedK
MPVILVKKDFAQSLDPAIQDPEQLQPLLVPYRKKDLTAYPVSTLVNNPRNQGLQCIEPISASG